MTAAEAALYALRSAEGRWRGLEVEITRERGHARALAEQAQKRGCETVVACGGDGTINEVAWGLLGSQTTLAILPAGSGNGLARALRIPRNPRRALAVLTGGEARSMDVGMANGKPFLNIAGAGFDADVGHAFDAHARSGGRRGLSTYFRLGLQMAWRYRAREIDLTVGGARSRTTALLVAFANGRQYGGGAQIAPRAVLDDGQLDVVTIEDASARELFLAVPQMQIGRIDRFRRYRRVLAASAVLTASQPVVFHRDGEPEGPAERIEITLLPRALRVLVPRACLADPAGPFARTP